VFQLQPPTAPGGAWTETVIHSFGGPDGGSPAAPVVIASDGTLYGTTYGGGKWNAGTVFQLAPPGSPGGAWTETVLHSFSSTPDGAQPEAGLAIGENGVLYGTTSYGGTAKAGTVFALHPPVEDSTAWEITILHSFTNTPDGAKPISPVTISSGGTLYGVTYGGGSAGNYGTVFEVQPPSEPGEAWTETVIHSFTGADGGLPDCRLELTSGGAVLGTTTGGVPPFSYFNNGTVFELLPPSGANQPWTENVLYVFPGTQYSGPEGARPESGLIIGRDGALYGTTSQGASQAGSCDCGVVYELQPPAAPRAAWTEAVLHYFDSTEGSGPEGELTSSAGTLYGTTAGGGASLMGTVFQLQP
jgi:uncharacterized repeat protein (TIGR03803 family)